LTALRQQCNYRLANSQREQIAIEARLGMRDSDSAYLFRIRILSWIGATGYVIFIIIGAWISLEIAVSTCGPWSFWEISQHELRWLHLSLPTWKWVLAKLGSMVLSCAVGITCQGTIQNMRWNRLPANR
jgi:ABC-type lipoprotein release transport system permease subunit